MDQSGLAAPYDGCPIEESTASAPLPQVAHLLSIAAMLRADLAPAWRPVAARRAGRSARLRRHARAAAGAALRRVALTLEVPVVSALFLATRAGSDGGPGGGPGGGPAHRGGDRAPTGADAAAAWRRHLKPVYAAHVVGLLGAATYSVRSRLGAESQ